MLLLIGSFLLLLVIGVPVALSIAVSSLLYVLVDGTMPDIAVWIPFRCWRFPSSFWPAI